MKIGIICYHTNPFASPGSGEVGGMNITVAGQTRELAAGGDEVDIYTRSSAPDERGSFEIAPRLRLHFLPAGAPRSYPKGELPQFISEFSASLAQFLEDADPWDVLHSQHWMSGIAALEVLELLAKNGGKRWENIAYIPHVVSYHSIAAPSLESAFELGERAEAAARPAAEKHLAQHADIIAAVSQAEADTVVRRLQGFPERIRIVHPGVDTEKFTPHPKSALPDKQNQVDELSQLESAQPNHSSQLDKKDYFLLAARLQPLKGIELAIRTWAEIPIAKRPHLYIAGGEASDSPGYAEKMHELVRRLDLSEEIKFLGARPAEEIASLMRDARGLLIPSYSETYGLVALEAAASGVPVIAADVGGLRESVRDEKTGLLLESRNPADWAAQINYLITHPQVAAELGARGRKYALAHSWKESAHKLRVLYEEARAFMDLRCNSQNMQKLHPEKAPVPELAQLAVENVLFVHAHPDDDTISTGALLSALSKERKKNNTDSFLGVLTATRGEKGEIRPESGYGGLSEEELTQVREKELLAALAELGAGEKISHYFLGMPPARAAGLPPRRYHDSGMRWVSKDRAGASLDNDRQSFTAASLLESAADIEALIKNQNIKWVISYDNAGTYGHPDHIRAHEATRIAACRAGAHFLEIVTSPAFAPVADSALNLGTTANIDEAPNSAAASNAVESMQAAVNERYFFLEKEENRLRAALRHYRTQLAVEESGIRHVGGQREELHTRICLRRRW